MAAPTDDAVAERRRKTVAVWAINLLTLIALLAVWAALLGAAVLCQHQGWIVAKWVLAVASMAYGVFALLAVLTFLLYLMDQEVRRGLKR